MLNAEVRAKGAILLAVLLCSSLPVVFAQQPDKKVAKSDLDAFMEKALARRDVNKRTLNDYILDETEEFAILGPARTRLYRSKRDYTWFVRDKIHVRSPLRVDGVSVGEEDRVRFEENWLRREKARIERRAKREQEKQAKERETREITVSPQGVHVEGMATGAVPTEPRFVSAAYFMDFKFEPGNYFLAGREKFEGQDVLKIEYYPTKLFGGDDDEKTPREIKKAEKPLDPKRAERENREQQREKELEQDIERKMNKTAMITLWVDPTNHQIVKYTFDNVWLDFLPGAWLVQVDEMRASMSMYQPFKDVWLPHEINIGAGITLANGSFEARYERSFRDYREAEVKSKLTIPKKSLEYEREPWPEDSASGPYVPEPQSATQEVVREIRVHGNVAVSEAEVLKIAGIAVDAPLAAGGVEAIEKRLKSSGWFETVQVRKRFRSIDDPTDIAIVLVVHEKPSVTVAPVTGLPKKDPLRVFRRRTMFLPILSYADGYGFTYGLRTTWNDLFGAGERLSVPLTWGGTRRVGVELERTFKRGPFTRLFSSASLYQRENPAFHLDGDEEDGTDDRRLEFRGRAERNFAHVVFTGVEATRARVEFGPSPAFNQWTVGADAALDTRGDPAFPGNAVYLGASWNGLHLEGVERINRYTLDGRGYLRLFGQPVLAGRAQYSTADAPLPLHERWLVGGSSTLRGFRTGAFHGDKTLVTSAELRVPFTSVLSGAKLGFTVFMDAAKSADHGFKLDDAKWEKSAGGGLFLIAPLVKVNMDIAKAFDGGTRFHLSSGFAF